MAKKLLDTPVDLTVLQEYLADESDFAFELRCLNLLKTLGLDCQHSGFYVDGVTRKPRQFDLRVHHATDDMHIRCAVECKHLQHNFPLLVLCVPRSAEESYHHIIWASGPSTNDPVQQEAADWSRNPLGPYLTQIVLSDPRGSVQQVRVSPSPVYPVGGPIAKCCAQVGRSQDSSIVASDADVFEKWSQALASVQDLADDSAFVAAKQRRDAMLSIVVPIMTVPDGTLWEVMFDNDGNQTSKPQLTDRCSFFVERSYRAGDLQMSTGYTVSHLEFVTMTGLKRLIEELIHDPTVELSERKWFSDQIQFET